MKHYHPFGWLLIDIANQFGLDKLTFEKRIEWAKTHLEELETLEDRAEVKPLFVKAVMALRKAQKGIPTGHLVGVDAVCSGLQIMSVLTGCVAGATATGLVDPDKRADAYGDLTEAMRTKLGNGFSVSRADAKEALMTALYGSKEVPKRLFGENTPELQAFYDATVTIAPGAWELLQDLLGSWNPGALIHQWKLPDGFDSKVKVMVEKEARIEVDELDHATFTYNFKENLGSPKGVSNAANVIHSVDAYILRCIQRRCNYDPEVVDRVDLMIEQELIRRSLGGVRNDMVFNEKVEYYSDQWDRTNIPDVVILPHLSEFSVEFLDTKHLQGLAEILNSMKMYKPFPVVTVHDEFKCHPNNVNYLRQQYVNILALLADSNLVNDLLAQVYGCKGNFQKLSNNLGDLIRNSNYGLC